VVIIKVPGGDADAAAALRDALTAVVSAQGAAVVLTEDDSDELEQRGCGVVMCPGGKGHLPVIWKHHATSNKGCDALTVLCQSCPASPCHCQLPLLCQRQACRLQLRIVTASCASACPGAAAWACCLATFCANT
jgi:hypothetical protein